MKAWKMVELRVRLGVVDIRCADAALVDSLLAAMPTTAKVRISKKRVADITWARLEFKLGLGFEVAMWMVSRLGMQGWEPFGAAPSPPDAGWAYWLRYEYDEQETQGEG